MLVSKVGTVPLVLYKQLLAESGGIAWVFVWLAKLDKCQTHLVFLKE